MNLRTDLVAKAAIALLIAVFLIAGCGSGENQPPARLTAGPSLSASPEFQHFENSHFGFFRAGGSYPYLSELGVHWQRAHPGPFVWGAIEKSPGVYDWSQTDRYVTDSQPYQILITATVWPYADWDQQSCHEKLPGSPFRFLPTLGDYRGKPCDQDAYRRFIAALVERYDGDGVDDMPGLVYPIKYWEVSNEPESSAGTPFFAGNPQDADYLELLQTTSVAITTADPDAKVLNGGIASLGEAQRQFWNTVFGGGSQYVDVLNIHAVPAPDDFNLAPLTAMMNELGLNRPIWVTEIQLAPARGSAGSGATTATAVPSDNTEAEQDKWASVLVKDSVTAFGRGADKLFYLGLDNATPTAKTALLINCSVVVGGELEEDHLYLDQCQKQKSFFAMKTMVARIDYFNSITQLAPGQYKVHIADRTVYVLWGDRPLPDEIRGKVRVSDIYGTEKEADATELGLTETPIYVESA